MAYDLGGNFNLTLDEQNRALANSGSDFRLQEPTLQPQTGAQPSMGGYSPGAPTGQENASAMAPQAPSPTDIYEPPEQQQRQNLAGRVLGIVGGLVGGGAGQIISGAGKAADGDKEGGAQSIVGGILG